MVKVVPIRKKQGRPRKAAGVGIPILETVPQPPSWLSRDAKAEWRRTAAVLVARKTLTEGDLPLLEAFCSAKGRLAVSERLVAAEGIVTVGALGGKAINPAAQAAAEAARTMKALGTCLGLSPASRRSAASGEVAGGDDRWGDMLE